MNSTTLRGIFPEPRPVHRRNFIKENVKQIKHMQGILHDTAIAQPRQVKEGRFRNVPRKSMSRAEREKSSQNMTRSTSNDSTLKKRVVKQEESTITRKVEKFINRSMQTERSDDIGKLYETGVIKFARPKAKVGPKRGQGDESLSQGMESLELSETKMGRDFVRENMKNIKPKHVKAPQKKPDLGTHEAGALPKYLQEKKEEEAETDVEECPAGYVLLPEEDRKITLRNLRQSYADRIQELNAMPVRSDTLRMRKRKMEIEEELKKIDGGIKIFQRPKVYVKIND